MRFAPKPESGSHTDGVAVFTPGWIATLVRLGDPPVTVQIQPAGFRPRLPITTMNPPDINIPSEPLLNCPTCGLPAEITDRFTLDGAPTPVEHVKLVCVKGHWCTPPVDQLPDSGPAQPSATVIHLESPRDAR